MIALALFITGAVLVGIVLAELFARPSRRP